MSIDLLHGSCFEGLAQLGDGAVDVMLTDPPFDAKTHRNCLESKSRNGRRVNGALPFPPLDDDAIETLASEFARVTQRWILVFCADRQIETWATSLERAGARFVRLGFAVRTNPRPQMSGDRPGQACDPIVIAHAGTGRMRWNGGGKPARWDSAPARFDNPTRKMLHPTQKPLALIRGLVEAFSEPGELVCDPFAGSGTTAVAAKQCGRRFIGWELSADYHRIALDRLADTRQQMDLLGLGAA